MKPSSWLIGSNNQKKAEEMRRILAPMGISLQTPRDIKLVLDVEEWGSTFRQNATLKALSFAAETRGVCVADDSGLCVDGLDGAPGVFSARFAGPDATDAQNNEKLRQELEGKSDAARRARYESVIAIACPQAYDGPLIAQLRVQKCPVHYRGFDALDSATAWTLDEDTAQTLVGAPLAMNLWLFAGTWEGHIGHEPKGEGGFGYDPWFALEDGRHAAELSDEEKNRRSHRGQALEELAQALHPA